MAFPGSRQLFGIVASSKCGGRTADRGQGSKHCGAKFDFHRHVSWINSVVSSAAACPNSAPPASSKSPFSLSRLGPKFRRGDPEPLTKEVTERAQAFKTDLEA